MLFNINGQMCVKRHSYQSPFAHYSVVLNTKVKNNLQKQMEELPVSGPAGKECGCPHSHHHNNLKKKKKSWTNKINTSSWLHQGIEVIGKHYPRNRRHTQAGAENPSLPGAEAQEEKPTTGTALGQENQNCSLLIDESLNVDKFKS